jgi:hypothetical protein
MAAIKELDVVEVTAESYGGVHGGNVGTGVFWKSTDPDSGDYCVRSGSLISLDGATVCVVGVGWHSDLAIIFIRRTEAFLDSLLTRPLS